MPLFAGASLNLGSYEFTCSANPVTGTINVIGSAKSFLAGIEANMTLNMNTSMPAFAFIPERSSLDYDYYKVGIPTVNYNSDFSARLNTNSSDMNLALTPFDLISGFYNNTGDLMYSPNRSHCYLEYFQLSSDNTVLFVNQEIGDVDLYLNSFNLNQKRNAIYSASQNVYFGTLNPYYQSVSNSFPSPSFYFGVNSREANLNTYDNKIKIQSFNASSSAGTMLNSINTSYTYLNDGFEPCQISDEDLGALRAVNTDKSLENAFLYYPNPVTNDLTIFSKSNIIGDYYITVYDNIGKKVYETTTNKIEFNIDFSKLVKGLYNVNIISKNGEFVQNIKILKE